MQADGGVLDVGVGLGTPDGEAGDWVRLAVRDTGIGIDADVLPRVFDPYFTTKRPGQGTGMGLAVVHGIVENHAGKIEITSKPGRGTSVLVYLPLTEDHRPQRDQPEVELQHGSERVLFVDDDPMVVDVTNRMLERLGYRVTALQDSEMALRTFLDAPHDFDLVVTDLTMPRLMGDELARSIHARAPDIPIVLCSGYNEAVDIVELEECGVRDFIKKPAQLPELAGTLRSVLDRVQERRYPMRDGAFVIFQGHPLLRAKLLDLSESGLAVSLEGEPVDDFDTDGIDRLSIISTVDGSSVESILCEPIEEGPMTADDHPTRRWGVRFAELTAAQLAALDEFIGSQLRRS